MLTPEKRIALLDSASELHEKRQVQAVYALLNSLTRSELIDEPELGFFFASALCDMGAMAEAQELTQAVRVAAQEHGDLRLMDRSQNLEASIEVGLGNLPRARELLSELVRNSSSPANAVLMAGVINNLGVISSIRCEWDDALMNFSRALAFFTKTGDGLRCGSCHHNLAMTYRQLGFYLAADTHFEYALSYARENRNESDLTFIEFERALLFDLVGDPDLAESTSLRALRRAQSSGNLLLEAEALRVVGTVANRRGRWATARRSLSAALVLGRSMGIRLLQAEALEQLVDLERAQGNLSESLNLARMAISLYRELGADNRATAVLEKTP